MSGFLLPALVNRFQRPALALDCLNCRLEELGCCRKCQHQLQVVVDFLVFQEFQAALIFSWKNLQKKHQGY
uniref:Uncharacterized protein n=1 Tax=Rhizophora mucronata TaxID=61149 RepID=A0A2P2PA89_RHIMU